MTDTILVRISGLAHGGAFIGEVVDEGSALKGKKAFVREAAEGELIEARVLADKSSYLEAELLRVLEPSAQRVTPLCPYFQRCGGCDLQHLQLAVQRDAKRRMVEGMLRMQGGLVARSGVKLVGASLPGSAYRRRIALHLNARGELGFYRPGSGEVVVIDRCLIAREPLNTMITALAPRVGALAAQVGGVLLEEHAGEVFVVLLLRDGAAYSSVQALAKTVLASVAKSVRVREGKKEFQLLPDLAGRKEGEPPVGHFSQVNEEGNAVLIETVCGAVKGTEVVEFYAGAGNLSFALARQGINVRAIEVDAALVAHGRFIAARSGMASKVEFVQASAQKYVSSHAVRGAVVLDPPRAGAKEVVRALSARHVSQVVYVSCSLPSLVRDLKTLISLGFILNEVRVVDMFAQTHHVECVAIASSDKYVPKGQPSPRA